MEQKLKELAAHATINKNKVSFSIHYASKFTVFVTFPKNLIIHDKTIIDDMVIELNGIEEKLSPCEYQLDFHSNHHNGRLIFLDQIYDFDYLFYNRELIDLKRMTSDRELVMLQKTDIHEEFKDYTSDLAYDLEVYKNFFDDFDSKISREIPSFQNEITRTLINTEGRKFMDFFLSRLKELETMVGDFNKAEHKRHGFYFRKQIMNFILSSEFMTRTNRKPRGYAGDSQMMHMIYQNEYRGESTFSKLLYKVSVEHPAAQAVRNRRIIIKDKLREYIAETESDEIRILSVACGPARELEDIITTPRDINRIHLTLLDQDKQALEEARTTVFEIEKRLGLKIKVTYLEDSIRTIMRDDQWINKIGKFVFIYSMGLFDYLATLVGKALMNRLFGLLVEGGTILIGNYHFKNTSRWFLEYWHDWVLFYRDEKDMKGLLDNSDTEWIDVFFEDTKCQMFLIARKGNESEN